MAQAGKYYPRAPWQDMRVGGTEGYNQRYYLPRRLWLAVTGTIGSLAAKWANDQFMSDLSLRSEDFGGCTYKTPHPTITTDDPHFLWNWFMATQIGTPTTPKLCLRLEYWEQDLLWGQKTVLGITAFPRRPTWQNLSLQAAFQDLRDPAQFTGLALTGIGQSFTAATWEDNPEYHPYRTRP